MESRIRRNRSRTGAVAWAVGGRAHRNPSALHLEVTLSVPCLGVCRACLQQVGSKLLDYGICDADPFILAEHRSGRYMIYWLLLNPTRRFSTYDRANAIPKLQSHIHSHWSDPALTLVKDVHYSCNGTPANGTIPKLVCGLLFAQCWHA